MLFPHQVHKILAKERDFLAKMSSIQEKMSAHTACSFFHLCTWDPQLLHSTLIRCDNWQYNTSMLSSYIYSSLQFVCTLKWVKRKSVVPQKIDYFLNKKQVQKTSHTMQ